MSKRQSGGSSYKLPHSSLEATANRQSRAKGPGATTKELNKFLGGGGKRSYGVSKSEDVPIVSLSKLKY